MTFCEHCGAQLSDVTKFCSSCGNAADPSAAQSTATPPKKSNRPRTILFAAAVLAAALGCLGLAAEHYFFHHVGSKAVEVTEGLPDVRSIVKELPASAAQLPATSPASPEPITTLDPNRIVTSDDGQCALFTKEELTLVLGTTFTHADADATGCTYKGDAPREWVRTEALWKGGRKATEDKKTVYTQLSHSMPKANIPIQPYPGAGDEAWVNLWNVVTACKGKVGVIMDLRYYHDSDELTKMLTNTALARLRDKKPDSAVRPSQSVQ